jgi:hypothetical protein
MHQAPASPLGQVIAAIISLLIAALTEHAAEHPLLAPGIRASIRRLEKLSIKLQAMVADWEATQSPERTRRPGDRPPQPHQNTKHSAPSRKAPGRAAGHAWRLGALASKHARAPVAISNGVPSARAPPARAPPRLTDAPRPKKLPRNPLRPGAAPAYPIP